jgi:homoserine O-acetyltransferase
MGASMGALQAFEWAARYTDKVEILIPVIGTGKADAFLIGFLDLWAQPIRLDPKWKAGAYEQAEQPMDGLKAALRFVTLHANHWEWANKTFGKELAEEGKSPFADYKNRFKIELFLDQAATGRANVSDANNFLYLVKASQSANADYSKIRARTLMLYAPTDLVFPASSILETAAELRKNGIQVRTVRLDGPNGHLNGLTQILPKAHEIQQFLNR